MASVTKYLPVILEIMYPDAKEGDYTLADQGDGPEIETWNAAVLGPRPTDGQILGYELPAAKLVRRRELRVDREEAHRRLFEVEGQFMESESAMVIRRESAAKIAGTVLAPSFQTKADQMDALQTRLNNRLTQVAGATTVAGVEAVAW